jgi:methylmalonyl-CoA/ethylmalonyl-CoA epimerase
VSEARVAGVDHIGVAVRSLAEAEKFYGDLGLECSGRHEVADQKVRVAFFPSGESRVELLESTDPEGPIGRFVEKKGPGLHHIALRVPDIEATLARLAAAGHSLIDEKPRAGAGGHRIAFVHPKSTGGVLIELVEAHP